MLLLIEDNKIKMVINLILSFNETNTFSYGEELPEACNKYYSSAFLRYLNAFYKIFEAAFKRCKFSSLLTLLAVRGIEDAGWDPYKSSIQIIKSITGINERIDNYIAQKNLHLWLYGHIMEASEPFEKLMNLLDIITGDQYNFEKFPPNNRGVPQSPGLKIQKIVEKSKTLGFLEIEDIYSEIWDRELRNSIFHSDYALYGNEVRIRNPFKVYLSEDINRLTNYSLAYFQVIETLHNFFISSFRKPEIIEPHPEFSEIPNEEVVVIVREGYGAVGIKDNWTLEQISKGAIPYRMGRFYPDEVDLLNKNPVLNLLPHRPDI